MGRLLSHRKKKTGYMPQTIDIDKRAKEIAEAGGQAVVFFDERGGRGICEVTNITALHKSPDFIYGMKLNDKGKVIKIFPKLNPEESSVVEDAIASYDAYVASEEVEFTAADAHHAMTGD